MDRLKISTRLYIIVVVMVLFGGVAYLTAINGMNEIRSTYDSTVRARGPITAVIDNIRQAIPDMKLQMTNMLVPDFPKDFLKMQTGDVAALKKDFGAFNAQWARNASTGASAAERTKMAEFGVAQKAWLSAVDQFMAHINKYLATNNSTERAKAFVLSDSGAVDKTHNTMDTKLEQLIKVNARENKKVAIEAEREQAAAMSQLGLAIALTLLIGIVCAVWIARSISTPVNDAVAFAGAVEAGDLNAKIKRHPGGEIGGLTHAIEAMKNSLVGKMEQLKEVAGVVAVAADEVVKTSDKVVDTCDRLAKQEADSAQALAELQSAAGVLSGQSKNLKSVASTFGDH